LQENVSLKIISLVNSHTAKVVTDQELKYISLVEI